MKNIDHATRTVQSALSFYTIIKSNGNLTCKHAVSQGGSVVNDASALLRREEYVKILKSIQPIRDKTVLIL